MTLSRDVINPRHPRNISDLKAEGYTSSKIPMGHLAVRTGPRAIEECNPTEQNGQRNSNPLYQPHSGNNHLTASAEAVWIDPDRFDAEKIDRNGNKVYQLTTLPYSFIADLDESTLFEQNGKSPAKGDLLIKSLFTAGRVQAVTRTQLNAVLTNSSASFGGQTYEFQNFNVQDVQGLRVGTVVGSGDDSGMVRVRFDLD